MRGLDLGHAAVMVGLMESVRDELAAVPTFWGGSAMTAAEAGADPVVAACRQSGACRARRAACQLRDALDVATRFTARPWQARTQIELARVIELSSRDAGRDQFSRLRESASEIAHDIGAPGIAALL